MSIATSFTPMALELQIARYRQALDRGEIPQDLELLIHVFDQLEIQSNLKSRLADAECTIKELENEVAELEVEVDSLNCKLGDLT